MVTLLLFGRAGVSRAQDNSLGWIAYVQNGDIWTMELPSGTPNRLTNDGRNTQPQISPSGEWIAFQKHGVPIATRRPGQTGEIVLWVMQRDGGNAQAAPNCPLRWAPDADVLGCSDENGNLGVIRAPNFSPQWFGTTNVTADGGKLTHTVWMAGQSKLVSEYASGEQATFWVLDAVTGTQSKAAAVTKAAEDLILIAAAAAPDEIFYWLVPFGSGSIQADGVALWQVKQNDAPRQLDVGLLTYRDWFTVSPARDKAALIAGTYRAAWTRKSLRVIDLNTTTANTLTPATVAASSPAWSPDGKQLAYAQMPDIGDIGGGSDARVGLRMRRIWVTDADGGNAHALTNDEAYRDEYPQWSNNGEWILFARYYQPDAADYKSDVPALWMMRADGSELQQVAELTGMNDNPPNLSDAWFGYYGHLTWFNYFDWWQPPDTNVLPSTGAADTNNRSVILLGMALLILGGLLLLRARFNVG